MLTIQLVILLVFVLAIFYTVKFLHRKKMPVKEPVPLILNEVLEDLVPFYQRLDENRKAEFENRAAHFLTQVRVTGVKTHVEELDKVLIAASAIIPIFNFPGWEYRNLHEVLLYPGSFDHEYNQVGEGRNILGMVGSGAMNHIMILSQYDLREAFINETSKGNTAIHEFVHLVDKTDGEIDGVPSAILNKKIIEPWLNLMQEEIQKILENKSDINPYGATNRAEFFAVVSEYFFERPQLLNEKHPQLYALLEQIFSPEEKQ